MDIVKEVGEVVGLETDDKTSMHVSIHEDNAGALVIWPRPFLLNSLRGANITQSRQCGFVRRFKGKNENGSHPFHVPNWSSQKMAYM
jgi:hypothetical protein